MKTNRKLSKKRPTPMNKSDIASHPDNRIDEDFPGYPHHPSHERDIKAVTKTDKKTAGVTGNSKKKK
jgi:hypothetical protein